jgi:glycosyltransferase involved in cell wall biosynthesis
MSDARPLVSIVIPCFNYARFLGEAIESALRQTHQPVEIIVVDDGSTDDTQAVARRYPVTLLSQTNGGVCQASNTGFADAHGEFALRLDADDRLASTYVRETLDALRREPCAHFAYTEASYFGTRSGKYPTEPFDPETLSERNYVHASALMRLESFVRVGGYKHNMTAARYEDWDLWLTFAERGMRGVLVPKPLLHYRQHAHVSRGTPQFVTLSALRREIIMARRLRDNHPGLFCTTSLFRRLATLPRRLTKGEVSVRFVILLVCLYMVMLPGAAHCKVAPGPRGMNDVAPPRMRPTNGGCRHVPLAGRPQ